MTYGRLLVAEKIKPGDTVTLTGRVTRTEEERGMTYVTVRIEGFDVPVTLRAEWVKKVS
jgi:transcription antitermination factor NusG